MAKVKILGRAVEVTSDYDFDTLVDASKYCGESLKLFKDEKSQEPIFRIAPSKGTTGALGDNGAIFVPPVGGKGKAVISFMVEDTKKMDDVRAYVAEEYGGALMKLNKVEQNLVGVIEQMHKDKEEILSNITEVSETAPTDEVTPADEVTE